MAQLIIFFRSIRMYNMVMNKIVLYASISIFSALGSWIPSLWHAGYLSIWGILGGIAGFFVGLWVYSLLNDYIDS